MNFNRRIVPADFLIVAIVSLATSCTPRPPPTTAFDGTYRGTIVLTNDPAGVGVLCSPWGESMAVLDGHVSFGRFNGYVEPNGTVQMVVGGLAGGTYLSGTFEGGHFLGEISAPQPGCNYRLELTRQVG
jgi:hypothetical protein